MLFIYFQELLLTLTSTAKKIRTDYGLWEMLN